MVIRRNTIQAAQPAMNTLRLVLICSALRITFRRLCAALVGGPLRLCAGNLHKNGLFPPATQKSRSLSAANALKSHVCECSSEALQAVLGPVVVTNIDAINAREQCASAPR